MEKFEDYFRVGKEFFNSLERTCGVRLGVGERSLVRSFFVDSGVGRNLEEMGRFATSCLVSLGYNTVELKKQIEGQKEYSQTCVLEYRRRAKLSN